MLCRNGIRSLLEGNVLWEAGSRPEWEGGSLSWCPGKREKGLGAGGGKKTQAHLVWGEGPSGDKGEARMLGNASGLP